MKIFFRKAREIATILFLCICEAAAMSRAEEAKNLSPAEKALCEHVKSFKDDALSMKDALKGLISDEVVYTLPPKDCRAFKSDQYWIANIAAKDAILCFFHDKDNAQYAIVVNKLNGPGEPVEKTDDTVELTFSSKIKSVTELNRLGGKTGPLEIKGGKASLKIQGGTGILLKAIQAASDAKDSPKGTVKVAGIVLKWINKDPATYQLQTQENYSRVEPLIREAAKNEAKIVCTTECFLDGYGVTMKDMPLDKFHEMAQKVPGGEYVTKLQNLSKELNIHLIAGLTELDGEKTYNCAILFGPDGQIIGKHRKKVIQWESYRNSPGDSFKAFQTPYGKIGMMICADRTEKATIEELAKNGADIVFCPSGGLSGESNDKILQQRSKEGKVPIVFVHPVEFLVTNAAGEILQQSMFGNPLQMKEPKDSKKYLGGVVKYLEMKLKSK